MVPVEGVPSPDLMLVEACPPLALLQAFPPAISSRRPRSARAAVPVGLRSMAEVERQVIRVWTGHGGSARNCGGEDVTTQAWAQHRRKIRMLDRPEGGPGNLCTRRERLRHRASGIHCIGHRQCRLWRRIRSISGIRRARRFAGGTCIPCKMGSRAGRSHCRDSHAPFRGSRMGSRGDMRAVRRFLVCRCGTG